MNLSFVVISNNDFYFIKIEFQSVNKAIYKLPEYNPNPKARSSIFDNYTFCASNNVVRMIYSILCMYPVLVYLLRMRE